MRRRNVQADESLLAQRVEGDAARAVERGAHDLLVRLAQLRIVEAHGRGEAAEDLRVRQRFAQRLDGAAVVHHVQMSVGLVQVIVLELRGGGEQHVRVVGGVGLEVLEDDGEEVLAPQPAQHALAIGSDRRRVRVVDDHRLDRRIVGLGQRFAEARHVDGADVLRAEAGALQRRFVDVKRAG